MTVFSVIKEQGAHVVRHTLNTLPWPWSRSACMANWPAISAHRNRIIRFSIWQTIDYQTKMTARPMGQNKRSPE